MCHKTWKSLSLFKNVFTILALFPRGYWISRFTMLCNITSSVFGFSVNSQKFAIIPPRYRNNLNNLTSLIKLCSDVTRVPDQHYVDGDNKTGPILVASKSRCAVRDASLILFVKLNKNINKY